MLICHEFDKQANNGTKIKADDKGGQPSLSYSVLKWWKDAQYIIANNFHYFFSSWYKCILHLKVELQERNIILQDVIRIIRLKQYKEY